MGLEIVLAERDLSEALVELEARLTERAGFYRGSRATAAFGTTVPTDDEFASLRRILSAGGIDLRGLSGSPAIEELARSSGLEFVEPSVVKLSDSARSLVADFAGARADIAERRKRGETSVRRHVVAAASAHVAHVVPPAPPETLYHVGTLRGGQALHHPGNIVVIGDVNPGTELVATGDIVIFGRLRGVAHAGAQGNADAHVYALRLDATQLRIATSIAADSGERTTPTEAEVALVRDGRIVIVPFDRIDLPGVL